MFSEPEKAQILHHLGYPKFQNYGVEVAFGHPSANPGSDLVWRSMERLSKEGEAQVRDDLQELACIELELSKLRSKASITRTAEVSFDVQAARRHLLADYNRAVRKLADDLGAPANPFARNGNGPRVTNMP